MSKHFGVICSPVPGHLNPMCTIGRELLARGHRVTVFNIMDTKEKILSEGLEFCRIGEEEFSEGAWERRWHPLAKGVGAKVLFQTIILHTLISKVMCRDITSKAKELGIDVLLIDQVQFQGRAIAEALGIPFANVACAIPLNRDEKEVSPPPFAHWGDQTTGEKILNKISWKIFDVLSWPVLFEGTKMAADRGLSIYHSPEKSYSPVLQLLPFAPSFNFTSNFKGKGWEFTGPFIDSNRPKTDFPFERLDPNKKIIYASFGTLQNRIKKLFVIVAKACKDLDVQLIVSLGQWRGKEALPELVGNPIIVKYAPQLEVLEKVDLCITHAGNNTVNESLSKGVPMISIPVTNDQPALGKRIDESKTGINIPLSKLTTQKLKEAIKEILENKLYKENSMRIASEMKVLGGTKRAADLIEQRFLT